MKKTRQWLLMSFITAASLSNAQVKSVPPIPKATIIAVVNRANWCTVCKENGERAGMVLMPYTALGMGIMMNDLTDETTKAASKLALEKEKIYPAVAKINQTGTIAFVSAKTHKLLSQISITKSDQEMKASIDKLLKK